MSEDMSDELVGALRRFDQLVRSAKRDVKGDCTGFFEIAHKFVRKVRADCVDFDAKRLRFSARYILSANNAYAGRLSREADDCFNSLYAKFLACGEYLSVIYREGGSKSYGKRVARFDGLMRDIKIIDSTRNLLEVAIEMNSHYIGVIDRVENN